MPHVPALDFADQNPHVQRLFLANDFKNFDISDEGIRCSRRAYFADISSLDDKIGALMTALSPMRMDDNTIILFCSDHGDMLGERGLWFKMSFFEGSARVPLMMRIPGQSPCTVATPVSTIDVTSTLAALAGIDLDEIQPWTDGKNLLPLVGNAASASPVLMEYAAEGSIAPLVSVRDGDFKFIHCPVDPPQLFDLASDPDEMQNLAGNPTYADKMVH